MPRTPARPAKPNPGVLNEPVGGSRLRCSTQPNDRACNAGRDKKRPPYPAVPPALHVHTQQPRSVRPDPGTNCVEPEYGQCCRQAQVS
jgi:hypothetical protein